MLKKLITKLKFYFCILYYYGSDLVLLHSSQQVVQHHVDLVGAEMPCHELCPTLATCHKVLQRCHSHYTFPNRLQNRLSHRNRRFRFEHICAERVQLFPRYNLGTGDLEEKENFQSSKNWEFIGNFCN